MRIFSIVCVVLPLIALVGGTFSPQGKYWIYVRDNLLGAYFTETLLLTVGAGICSFLLGTMLAWFMSIYDFVGKKFFQIALVLPLAIPPYIAAYTYEGLLGYTGPIQSFFRNYFDIRLSGLTAAIPSQVWAIWIFSVTLFPYVYILVLSFLRNQSASIFENALLLGGGRTRLFFKVGFPLLRPIAIAGTILVCLEVLNDFGVSKFYGLNTFTTAIFATWFGMGDVDTAINLAFILLAVVCAVLIVRKAAHKARRYHIVSSREKPLSARKVSGARQALIVFICGFVCLAGFVAPLAQMLYWLEMSWDFAFTAELGRALLYTLYTSVAATIIIMVVAIGTVNAGRISRGKFSALLAQISMLGYSIPSSVLAIGVVTLFINIDNFISFIPSMPDKLFSMSSAMLLFAYSVRFFSIGYQGVETGFAKTGMLYTEASRTMGRNVTATFFLVDLPMIRPALISASVLVFIDILKELPLSMMLRPFNTETLGTTVYHFANNEVLENTALPSLCIVLSGTIFIVLIQIWENKRRSGVFRN